MSPLHHHQLKKVAMLFVAPMPLFGTTLVLQMLLFVQTFVLQALLLVPAFVLQELLLHLEQDKLEITDVFFRYDHLSLLTLNAVHNEIPADSRDRLVD